MPAAISPPPFTPLKDSALFKPLKLGKIALEHRLVLAPLTRMRGVKESEGVYVPSDLAVEYYKQRASKGGLLLTEATDICHYASGYPGTPGVFSPSQIAGWKKVTDAVHAKGGFIFCQIWHTGRASTPGLRGGQPSLSASDIPISGGALDGTQYGDAPPKPMTVEEIKQTTQDFADAAKKAVEAGFDGVEIHGKLAMTTLGSQYHANTASQVPTATSLISSSTTTSTSELTPTVVRSKTALASLSR